MRDRIQLRQIVSSVTDFSIRSWIQKIKGLNRKGTSKNMEIYMRQVPVYNTSKTNAAKIFLEQLQTGLKAKCHINATEVLSVNKAQAGQGQMSILIYNNTDSEQVIDNCFKDMNTNHLERIILIVLHVVREEALHPANSKKKLQTGKNSTIYREVGRIIDIGFQLDEGIYSCSMNTSAFQEIKQFCSGYKPAKAKFIYADQHGCTNDQSVAGIFKAAYIMVPSETAATKLFVNALQDKLNEYGVSITSKPTCDVSELDPNISLILVCNNTSRLATDIDTTLRDRSSSLDSRTILLVLHVGDDPEPNTNTRRTLGPDKYKNISIIIDIAFSTFNGLYPCDMNNNALAILEKMHSIRASHTNVRHNKQEVSSADVDLMRSDCLETSELLNNQSQTHM